MWTAAGLALLAVLVVVAAIVDSEPLWAVAIVAVIVSVLGGAVFSLWPQRRD